MTVFGKPTERRFPKATNSSSPGPAYGLPSTLSKRGVKVQNDIIDDGQRTDKNINGNKIYKSNRESWIGGAKSNGGLAYAGKKDYVSPGPVYKPSVHLVKQRIPVSTAKTKEKRFLRPKVRYMGKAHANSMRNSDPEGPGPGDYSAHDPRKPKTLGKQFGAGRPRPPKFSGNSRMSQRSMASEESEQQSYHVDDRDAWIRGVPTGSGGFTLKDVADEVGPALMSMGIGDRIMQMTKPYPGATRIPTPQENRESKRFGNHQTYIDKDHEVGQKGLDSPGPMYHPKPPPIAGGKVNVARDDWLKEEENLNDIREFKQQFGEETMNKKERFYSYVHCPDTPGPGQYQIRSSPVPPTHHKGEFGPPQTEEARHRGKDLSMPRGFVTRRPMVYRPKTAKSDESREPEYCRPWTGRASYKGYEDPVAITDQLGPNISPRTFPERPSSASGLRRSHHRPERTLSAPSGERRPSHIRRLWGGVQATQKAVVHRPQSAHLGSVQHSSRAQSPLGSQDMAYIRSRPSSAQQTNRSYMAGSEPYAEQVEDVERTSFPYTPIKMRPPISVEQKT